MNPGNHLDMDNWKRQRCTTFTSQSRGLCSCGKIKMSEMILITVLFYLVLSVKKQTKLVFRYIISSLFSLFPFDWAKCCFTRCSKLYSPMILSFGTFSEANIFDWSLSWHWANQSLAHSNSDRRATHCTTSRPSAKKLVVIQGAIVRCESGC